MYGCSQLVESIMVASSDRCCMDCFGVVFSTATAEEGSILHGKRQTKLQEVGQIYELWKVSLKKTTAKK